MAGEIEAGTVWINEYHLLSAVAPRGGFKDSETERELGSEGIMEFTQARHILVNDEEHDSEGSSLRQLTGNSQAHS
ncbi:MAG: aldehyde dehydrogenase family protein [Nitrososphaerota archaeon]|nr:aldehyde dehydrogenase family protein [Nitrososphaerota archaeon]MDG6922942.1 aldehyde dehydrogenase family protein [Nitrososphaerota archaeon]